MAQEQTPSPPFSEANKEEKFIDPGRKPWVWIIFTLLFVGMLPLWPVKGTWLGLPAWAVLAIVMSFMTSLFTAYVILQVWQDPGNDFSE